MKTFLTLLIFDKIGDAILKSLRTLMMAICELVYNLIVFCFDVFQKLGTAQIVSDAAVNGIFNKISLILGIFMIFRLTFAAIQYIINPDLMTDKNKGAGNIIKKVIITIVLLGSVNYIFKIAYDIQNYINEDNVLGRVLLGDIDSKYKNEPGKMVANNLFKTFFRINEDISDKNDYEWEIIEASGGVDFTPIYRNLNETGINTKTNEEEFVYKMDGYGVGILAIGLAGLYVIFMFTIQVAVRLFQLAYLQIIAPIPIMMYITPKGDEQLKKWGQQCLTTFLDFFIRTAIIYFAIYLIGTIVADKENMASSMSEIWTGNIETDAYILGILIIGVLMFAKKVPNLLKEIFPSIGGAAGFSYDISGKAFKDTMKLGYKATPIGWGLKLGKSIATSGIGAIDRKKYGLPKPRTKLQEKMDKLTPGRAEAIKNKRAGAASRIERDQLYREGEEYYNMFPDHEIKDENGKLRAGVFQNSAYAESWQKVADAKAKNKKYEAKLVDAQAKVARGEITVESEEYKSAVGNAKAANGRLEAAKQDHENIRKIYTKDARREDAYNYYHDMQFDVPSNVTPQTNNNNNSQSSDVYRSVNEVTGVSRPSASENGAPTADNSLLGELASQVEQEQLQRDFQNNLRNENNANNNTSNSHDNRQYSNGDDVGE